MRGQGHGRWALAIGLGWLSLSVLAPLLVLLEAALPFELLEIERVALLRAAWRGVALAGVVATASVGLGWVLARAIGPLPLLALLLIGRAIAAHGVLSLGLAPGPTAAVLALVCDLVPFSALIVWLRLHTRPRALIEAAADLGAGAWLRWREIEWPHLRPAVVTAWLWALIQTLGDAIAFELAGGGHSYTPGLLIRDALIHEDAPDRALVAVLAVLLVALPCAWALTSELDDAARSEVRGLSPAPAWLRGLAWLALGLLFAGPAALLLGPQPEGVGAADRALAQLSSSSLQLGGLVAIAASCVGFGLAVLARGLERVSWLGLLGMAVLAPLAIPSSVQGSLMLEAATRVGVGPGPMLTALALFGPALALAFVAARMLTAVIPARLLEAAADLGAGGLERLRLVWLPLGRPALVIAAVVVFAWVLGEAAIPASTSGPGGDTLAVGLTIHARAGAMALVRRWSLLPVLAAVLATIIVALLTRSSRR